MSSEFAPRRVRIVEKGWENFTGQYGTHDFKDGVSVDHLTWRDTLRLGSIIKMVDADDGKHGLGASDAYLRFRDINPSNPDVVKFQTGEALKVNPNTLRKDWTREELEAVADKDGLNGVRDIARHWGKTGRSIVECINAILEAQKPETPVVEPAGGQVEMEEPETLPGENREEQEVTPSEVTVISKED